MLDANDIKWGRYLAYEGPYFPGSIPYTRPENPDFGDKVLAVLTATEGGHYDAVNMYDSCIMSLGLTQFCEKFYLVSDRLLGPCAELDLPKLISFFRGIPYWSRCDFKKNAVGKWRFYDSGKEVATPELQRLFFLGDADVGKIGSWGSSSRSYAKAIAAALVNIWSHEPFQVVQREATKKALKSFILPQPDLQAAFVSVTLPDYELTGYPGALRAMFYSFAGNNPTLAAKAIRAAWNDPRWATASPVERFCVTAQALTFSSKIAIYPGRYNKIAPVLTKLFDVNIPLTSAALGAWTAPSIEVTDDEGKIACGIMKLSDELRWGLEGPQGVVDEETPDGS